MSTGRLAGQGANAKTPAKLPALQAMRKGDDPHPAVEALREWVEVRLGSRGDKYEKAVTLRELQQTLAPLQKALDAFGVFDGTLSTLRTNPLGVLPALRQGAFEQIGDDLFYCNGKAWKQVTLT